MPLPFLIAVAAYVGAKKGAKEAIESSQQDGSSLQRELNRPTYVDVSVTNIQKVAIDRLLSNVKYRVLNELRSRLQNDRIEVNFYALVLQKDRLNDFFQFYPALSQFFRQKVNKTRLSYRLLDSHYLKWTREKGDCSNSKVRILKMKKYFY